VLLSPAPSAVRPDFQPNLAPPTVTASPPSWPDLVDRMDSALSIGLPFLSAALETWRLALHDLSSRARRTHKAHSYLLGATLPLSSAHEDEDQLGVGVGQAIVHLDGKLVPAELWLHPVRYAGSDVKRG
jgi:hypothetical protein